MRLPGRELIFPEQGFDNEIAEIYYFLHYKLLSKHDQLGEKLKNNIYLFIKEKLKINNEIQSVFDENNLPLLKDLVLKVVEAVDKTIKKTDDNRLFLLFILFLQYHKSIYFENVLWNFIKIISVDNKQKKVINFKQPPKEISSQLYTLLKRKNSIKQGRKYYKIIGPYYETYHRIKTEREESEDYIMKNNKI